MTAGTKASKAFDAGSTRPAIRLSTPSREHSKRIGYRTFQGLHYVSPGDSTKSREVDVVAAAPVRQIAKSVPADDVVAVEMIVECKVLRVPWVVLTRRASIHPSQLLARAIGSRKAIETLTDAARQAWAPVPDSLTTPERHGFSVVESRPPSATRRRSEERKRDDDRVDAG